MVVAVAANLQGRTLLAGLEWKNVVNALPRPTHDAAHTYHAARSSWFLGGAS
jgi:hypothetical protein